MMKCQLVKLSIDNKNLETLTDLLKKLFPTKTHLEIIDHWTKLRSFHGFLIKLKINEY